MSTSLQSWQRSTIRNSMERYRRAQEDYYVSGKPLVELPDGSKAFSLVSPPLGSPATRRRIRRIVDNMVKSGDSGGRPRSADAARHDHRGHLQLPVRLRPLLGGPLPGRDRPERTQR